LAQSQTSLSLITVTGKSSALDPNFFSVTFLSSSVGTQYWASSNPARFSIVGKQQRGSYAGYYYQLYSEQGDALTGPGYSVEEHVWPDTGINSNDRYVPMNNGVAYDQVGWKDVEPPANAFRVVTQTFTVQYQGQYYDLSSVFVHTNQAFMGVTVNTVFAIQP
jgi:hypothetical protein